MAVDTPEVVVTGIEPVAPAAPAAPAVAPVDPPTIPASSSPIPADWRSGLPDHMRASPTLEKFSSVEALAGGYMNAQQMIGRDKIPMPKNDVELREVQMRLGALDAADKYTFAPAELPEGMEVNANMESAFKEVSHKVGLLPAQAAAIHKLYTDSQAADFNSKNVAADTEAREASVRLRTDWGAQFDEKLALANRAISTFGGDELVNMLAESGLDNNPVLAKTFAKVAELISEDKLIDGAAIGLGSTPAQIRAEINELMSDSAYTDKYDPRHKALVERVMRTRETLHATKKF